MSFLKDPSIWLKDFLAGLGLNSDLASFISTAGVILIILLISWLSNLITRIVIQKVVGRIARKRVNSWIVIINEQKVFTRLSHLVPALIIWSSAGWVLKEYPVGLIVIQRFAISYMLIVALVVINSFVEAWYRIYLSLPISQNRPIKGYVQIVKVILVILFSLLIFSVIFKKEVSAIIAGLGVMASVIILIFKDAILGLVASIQLSANKMLKVGDWISIPDRNVDGEVLDITLTTAKIRNFDKTVVTVPTYSLINETFQNWVGMQESGVRRIKRSFLVDVTTVKFADERMKDKMMESALIRKYFNIEDSGTNITKKEAYGKPSQYFMSGKITNLGIFRMYAEALLLDHPKIEKSQALIVRHRPPSEDGIPLQVYAFTNCIDLVTYENVQSEIFEHLMSVMNEYELRIFQLPSEYDYLGKTINRK